MLIGASVGFIVADLFGFHAAAFMAAGLASGLLSLLFGLLVVVHGANQVAAGLAITVLGAGASALIGNSFVGNHIDSLHTLHFSQLSELRIVGPALFNYDPMVYLAVLTTITIWLVLYRTRWGLCLRSVGEAPEVARDAGISVGQYRLQAIFLCGLLSGLGGSYLSLVVAQSWTADMTAGRGFIAVALVIVSRWHPMGVAIGASVFGAMLTLQLRLQIGGMSVSPFILDIIPFLMTICFLIFWSLRSRHDAMPKSLERILERG